MGFRIHHSMPTLGEDEVKALEGVVMSSHLSRGPLCEKLENSLAQTVGLERAYTLTSGSAALHLALLALGASQGKKVLIPSLTCGAVLNAVRYTGAEPLLYDSSYEFPEAGALSALVDADTAAVVLVAPPQGMGALDYDVSSDGYATISGVPIVLDRCQQLSNDIPDGARAHVEVFSFYATKCISAGNGGAITTSSTDIYERVIDLSQYDGRETYTREHYNYSFDDLRASVAITQLEKLSGFVSRRREHAEAYAQALNDTLPERGMVYRYLYDVRNAQGADDLVEKLANAEVEAKRPVYRPLHSYLEFDDVEFPITSDAWARYVSLPVYPSLSDDERQHIIDVLSK